jgi:hypothetical protein
MQYRKFSNFQWPYPVENKAIATKNSECLTATGGQKEKMAIFGGPYFRRSEKQLKIRNYLFLAAFLAA